MKKINLASHFAALVIVTVLCGLIYASVQQSHRTVANDPQLQMARDLKDALEHHRSIGSMVHGDSIDLSKSLSVFICIYNKNGEPVTTTGWLNGQAPRLPRGVFDYTLKNGEDIFSWQPEYGVRMATVTESIDSPGFGFITVGRSLKEVEKRESSLTMMVAGAWLVCTGIILLHFLFTYFTYKNQDK